MFPHRIIPYSGKSGKKNFRHFLAGPKKQPDPEVFLKAAEYLGLPAMFCLVVEDAVSGLQAAAAAEMDCAAVGDAASAGLATYDLNTFADLLNCVE